MSKLNCDSIQVLFIATANTLSTIPTPLQDRMEIVEIPGYSIEDKIPIAVNHLLPKQLKLHGLTDKALHFKESALECLGLSANPFKAHMSISCW